MKYKIVCFAFVILLFSIKLLAQTPVKSYPGVVVVELFTSQGDINCLQADKILSNLIADAEKNNKPVYCIALHVDFWNRFGWMDPFSSLKYTNRLQNYSSAFGDRETYTPRFIINGKSTPDNPDQEKITEIVTKELSTKVMMNPEFTYTIFDDTLDISFDVNVDLKQTKSGSNFYINVVIVESGLSTKVTAGDNKGKMLLNDNVARLFYTTDLKTSKGLVRVPLKGQKKGEKKSIVVFIQDKKSKAVAGAAIKDFR